MCKFIFKYLLIIFLIAINVQLIAQPNRSSYFIEGSTYGHQINPAFIPENNYISIPALGNANIGLLGNVGLSDFIYEYNDPNEQYELTTFLNPSIESDLFLGNLNTNNRVQLNISLTPISTGFYAWGGYNICEIGIRSNSDFNLPIELFDLLKNGAVSYDSTTYNIENMRISSNSYANISFGHSRIINDKLSVGGKLKIILGIANINVNLDLLNIYMSKERYEIESKTSMDISLREASFVKENNNGENKITSFKLGKLGIGGLGFGIDLGATYKIIDDDMEVSLSVLDLGLISWNTTIYGKSNAEPFIFEGFDGLSFASESENEDESSGIGNQIESLTDDITNLTSMYQQEENAHKYTALTAALNLGVKYKMPFYDQLSIGLLSHTRFNPHYTYAEGRLFANISPLKWFDFSVNYGLSNFGQTVGCFMNFHPKRFNIFIGSDQIPSKISPQYIPVNKFKANLFLGLNYTFGKKFIKIKEG